MKENQIKPVAKFKENKLQIQPARLFSLEYDSSAPLSPVLKEQDTNKAKHKHLMSINSDTEESANICCIVNKENNTDSALTPDRSQQIFGSPISYDPEIKNEDEG